MSVLLKIELRIHSPAMLVLTDFQETDDNAKSKPLVITIMPKMQRLS